MAISVTNVTGANVMASASMGANVTYIGGAVYTGDALAAGTYSNLLAEEGSGDPALTLFDRGCLITTGKATDVETKSFPNSSGSTSVDIGAAGPSGDTTTLSFQFSPLYAIVVVPFMFGSEEYPEFNSSPFNDTCSFIFNGVEKAYYSDGVTPITINNSGGGNMQNNGGSSWCMYDGVAFVNLIMFVVPGTNCFVTANVHDVRDGLWDSGVLIGQITSFPGLPTTGTGLGTLYNFIATLLPLATPTRINALIAEYIAVVGADPRILISDVQIGNTGGSGGSRDGNLGDNGPTDTGSTDDGEIFQAYVKTRAYQPGGKLSRMGEAAHTAQPLLIARPQTSTAIYLDIIRDLEYERQQTHVDLTPVASERHVIRKFEAAATGDATEVQFQIGDAAPIISQWDLHLFTIRLTDGGTR